MPLLLLLLIVAQFCISSCIRGSVATGLVTFTSMNSTQSVTTTHIHNASTTLGLVTFKTGSPATDAFSNITTTLTVTEGTDTDTINITLNGQTTPSPNTNFTIQFQYLRITKNVGFQIVSGVNVTNTSKTNTLTGTLAPANSTYGNVSGFLFLRGFSDIALVSSAKLTTSTNITLELTGNPTSGSYLTADILIANMSSLIPKCNTCTTVYNKITYNATSTNNSLTIPKQSPYLYVFSIIQTLGNSTGETNLANNTFTITAGEYGVTTMTIDPNCLSSFVPVNDLQTLMGWEIAVIIVGGAVVLTLVGLAFWYLSILVKRDELAREAFISGSVAV